jgi:hypothetical protein
MQLSKNFTLTELTKTQVRQFDNIPNESEIANLKLLSEMVLQPIRDLFGAVTVNSGYRSVAVNSAVGGSPTSDHTKGQAADIEVIGKPNRELAEWIKANLRFTQIILEFPGIEPNEGWVHVSYNPKELKQQVLTAKRVQGKTKYFNGLV